MSYSHLQPSAPSAHSSRATCNSLCRRELCTVLIFATISTGRSQATALFVDRKGTGSCTASPKTRARSAAARIASGTLAAGIAIWNTIWPFTCLGTLQRDQTVVVRPDADDEVRIRLSGGALNEQEADRHNGEES